MEFLNTYFFVNGIELDMRSILQYQRCVILKLCIQCILYNLDMYMSSLPYNSIQYALYRFIDIRDIEKNCKTFYSFPIEHPNYANYPLILAVANS